MTNKVVFNPKVKWHRDAVKHFMEFNAWGKNGCPFVTEDKVSIVNEITSKLLKHFLKVQNPESII